MITAHADVGSAEPQCTHARTLRKSIFTVPLADGRDAFTSCSPTPRDMSVIMRQGKSHTRLPASGSEHGLSTWQAGTRSHPRSNCSTAVSPHAPPLKATPCVRTLRLLPHRVPVASGCGSSSSSSMHHFRSFTFIHQPRHWPLSNPGFLPEAFLFRLSGCEGYSQNIAPAFATSAYDSPCHRVRRASFPCFLEAYPFCPNPAM
jgi:hypothetical protein